ncbi:hypothetical protein C3488_31470 [Streptomyces sp. Ru72]|nr:hypothetical protein C3488_31470 [Streptomyces sp. Ru72]
MSMMLPDELEWVLEMLGYRWPTADEDKLKECAALWRKFGDDVTELHTAANASARQVVAHNAGESIDAFTKTYAKFDGGGSGGYLANAAQAAHIIATVLEACAYLVEFAKWAVIAQLIALAIEIAAAQAAAPFTFGLSEVGALGATQATRLIVRRLLDELKEALLEAIVEAMKEPAISMIEAIITDLIRQTVNVGFGAQEGYDLATTVKKGTDSAWDAIKQTPQTLAEGVRDSLGQKAGHRAHHAIDSRIDGYHESGTSGGDGADGDGGGDGTSDSSSESSSDSGPESSSRSSSDSSPDSSSGSSSDSSSTSSNDSGSGSGADSSTSNHTNTAAGTHIGGGISADAGGTHVGTPDLGAGPDSDHSGSDTGQNPSTSDIPTPRHTTSLSDFDDPAPGGPSHGAPDTSGSSGVPSTSGPTGTGGGSSPSGISSPTPHAAPSHASPSGTASPAGSGSGGGIGTSIDSLAASAPTHSSAAPTPTTSDPSPAATGGGGRVDGVSAIPTPPVTPSTTGGATGSHQVGSTSGSTSPTATPSSPTANSGPVRTPSASTSSTPSSTATGPASTPSPTSPTTPRSTPGPTADGRVSGTADGRVSGTADGRIPTPRTPGTAPDGRAPSRNTPDERTASPNTSGATPGDRTPPRTIADERTTPRAAPDERATARNTTEERTTARNAQDDRTTARNTPGTTPGDRTAPRNTSDATDARTPTRSQNPSPNSDPTTSRSPSTNSNPSTSPNRNPASNPGPSQSSSPSPSTGGGPSERTSTPSNNTPNSATQPGSTTRPGSTQTPTASGAPGTQHQPGTRPTPSRSPNPPAGAAPGTPAHPHAPQEPASQHDRSKTPEAGTDKPHDPQHHQVTPVPIHTVPHAPSSPTSQASHATPPPPGAPHAQPGASPQQHPHQDNLNDIRNDLNHYPGGLTEPHPDDQQALVNAVPHNPDGTPQRFPDPFGSWSQLQNDGGNTVPGRSNNCADCSRSFLETWYGNPQVSAPRTLDVDEHGNPDPWSPEHNANANQIRWAGASHIYAGTGSDPHTPARIAWDLQQAGHGAAAIVQVSWPGGGGHAFNAVNYHGHVLWIDTQSGEVSHQPLHIPNATGVWHIPLDADRNPIHPPQTDSDTTHHESDTPQQGTDASDQGPDNSPQANEQETSEPNPSQGTPDHLPGRNPSHPESAPTAGTPSLTDTDGHTKDGPPHADTPKSEEPSRGHSSGTAHTPDPNRPDLSGDGREGNGSDRDTSQARSGAPTSGKGTRSDETDTHRPHPTGTISEHPTPSPAENSGAPAQDPVTGEATPSAPHAAPSDPTTHAPPAPAGAHQQAPEEPAAGPPNSAENSHTEHHAPAAESHHPLDDPSRTNHPRLTEPETVHSTHYGMLPMPDQQNLRQTNDVRQVGLDPVHQQLNGWLNPVPSGDGNGTRIPLVDALRECAPPRPDDPDHTPRILRHEDLARILPGFDDMHPGERGAVVASLARLSLNFHESHAVGASPEPTPGYPNHATKAHENAGWNAAHRRDDPNESDDPDGLEKAIREAFGKAGFTGALRDSGEHRPDFTGRNYAAVEVHDPASGKISYVVDSSYPNPGGGEKGKHSERNILDYLDTLNEGRPDGKKYEPLSMYSDREPCGRGQGYANCARLLSEKMPGVDVYYGTGYRKQAEVVDPDESPKGGYKKRFDMDLAKNIVALGKIWTRAMSEGGLIDTGTE